MTRQTRQKKDLSRPVTLTIAGLDPSGGAGIIADIRTFEAFGCFPAAVVTSLTFQNSKQVFGAQHVNPETLRAQVTPIVAEHKLAGVKIGLLPTRDVVREVVSWLSAMKLPAPIVDPVVRSSSGYVLVETNVLDSLIEELFPLARLVTPNIPEAEQITGLEIVDEEGMRLAARKIRELGARAVLIKGGHLRRQGASDSAVEPVDVLNDGDDVMVFRGEWIEGELRGTGCILSAAIAAGLAKGMNLADSISEAKHYVADKIAGHRNLLSEL